MIETFNKKTYISPDICKTELFAVNLIAASNGDDVYPWDGDKWN